MSWTCRVIGSLLFSVLVSTVGHAADFGNEPEKNTAAGPRHEIRGGVLYHDTSGKESGVDLNAEYLSKWAAFDLFIPRTSVQAIFRPHIGANLNLQGDTSYGYAGYSLTLNLTSRLFLEGSFGGMVHNGMSDSHDDSRLDLGCNVMFRESIAAGFRLTDDLNVSGILEHGSNAGSCSDNNGITNVGIRVGYAF
ncbi:acyloxyacyl hydrolase [Roseibium sp. MMSF_3544]|uniref:acyloxyacyl hydrolase n=1 Tax=unclassified Roseibium TaxID=2629323 RepID=UPI00273F0AA5|nr:acyloxyacyl hydrolase [Roseibium sp. MMSF_3544]